MLSVGLCRSLDMIGETIIIGNRIYLQINRQGTLEKLPRLKWYRQMQLYIITRNSAMSIGSVREFIGKHGVCSK